MNMRYKLIMVLLLISVVVTGYTQNVINENASYEYKSEQKPHANNYDNSKSIDYQSKIHNKPTILNSCNMIENEFSEYLNKSKIKQLQKKDYEVTYKNFTISKSTKIHSIYKKLGIPKDYDSNNRGYISGNSKYRRWNLCYPNYSKPKIQIIVLSKLKYVNGEVKDGNSYIVGIYLTKCHTRKGLKVGDDAEKHYSYMVNLAVARKTWMNPIYFNILDME